MKTIFLLLLSGNILLWLKIMLWDEIKKLIIVNWPHFPGRLFRNNVNKNTFSIDFLKGQLCSCLYVCIFSFHSATRLTITRARRNHLIEEQNVICALTLPLVYYRIICEDDKILLTTKWFMLIWPFIIRCNCVSV